MSAPTRYKSCARGEFRKGYELLRIRKRIVFLSSQKMRFGFCDGNNEPSAIEVKYNLQNVLRRRCMLAPGVGSNSNYKMHLPEFRNMVPSRTVEAPCSFNEDTFPREKSVETQGIEIGGGDADFHGSPTNQTSRDFSSDCVRKASSAHKGLPHWEYYYYF
ncbi:hypothetical protein NC651_036680 [Populus alba x Populus x berolinensis]|nr:hypothetical protein NC651_036680 [Populus alba x Populus x berolinensis]